MSIKNASNAMLVTVTSPRIDEDCMSIKTYDAQAGNRGRFLLIANELARWVVNGAKGAYYTEDCGNILRVARRGGSFLFRLWWMSGSSLQQTAIIREFSLTIREMKDLFIPGASIRKTVALTGEQESFPRVEFSAAAHKSVEGLSPTEKTALKKFLRNAFRWPGGGEITVVPDGGKNFFFRERGGICGGIILHRKSRGVGNGVAYEIHT